MAASMDEGAVGLLTGKPTIASNSFSPGKAARLDCRGMFNTSLKCKYNLVLGIYCITISIFLVISLLLNPNLRSNSDAAYTLSKFGSDRRYQSLNHTYDELWNTLHFEESGFIQLRNEGSDGPQKLGSITM